MSLRLLYIALCLFLASPVGAQHVLVNGTAAKVGDVLITIEDSYFYRALKRFLDGKGDPFDLEQHEALKKTVQKLIFQEMVYKEIQAFQFEGVKRAEASGELQKQKKTDRRGVWKKILKRYGQNDKAAIDLLLKDMLVEKFVQQRVETLTPVITQAEIEKYYEQNRSRFRGSDFENLKPTIVLLLKKARVEKGLQEWIRYLKDKYGVTDHLTG